MSRSILLFLPLHVLSFLVLFISFLFFFNATATTEIYTLSLHDALPILFLLSDHGDSSDPGNRQVGADIQSIYDRLPPEDRKSTRLNSSHQIISYAVFCLKKKKINRT